MLPCQALGSLYQCFCDRQAHEVRPISGEPALRVPRDPVLDEAGANSLGERRGDFGALLTIDVPVISQSAVSAIVSREPRSRR